MLASFVATQWWLLLGAETDHRVCPSKLPTYTSGNSMQLHNIAVARERLMVIRYTDEKHGQCLLAFLEAFFPASMLHSLKFGKLF